MTSAPRKTIPRRLGLQQQWRGERFYPQGDAENHAVENEGAAGTAEKFNRLDLEIAPRHCKKLVVIERAFRLDVEHAFVEPVPKLPHRIEKELTARLHHHEAAARF